MHMVSALAHIHIQFNGIRWPSGSVLMASLALAFTIGAFWWLNARQGRLKSFEPHSFAAWCGFQEAGLVVLLRLPLVLYNTGAIPIVVQDIRLSLPREPHSTLPLRWRTTRSQIMPKDSDAPELAAVFSVPGRTAQQMFIEFGGTFPGLVPEARDYQALIEIKLGHRKKWKHIIQFSLRAGHITSIDHYITYRNAAYDLTPGLIAEAEASLKEFRKRIEQQLANQ
jgi:hypothetical protein